MIPRPRFPILLLAAALVATSCDRGPEPDYRQLYDAVEADPFDTDLLARAMHAASRAESRHSTDRWAYILGSYAQLRGGYSHGDAFKAKNYTEPSLKEARRLAEKVREMCPDRAECLIPSARLDIVENKLESAKSMLNQAYLADTANFYVWYYRAEVEARIKQTENARIHLDDAKRLATQPWHLRWVVDSKIDLAARAKDYPQVESLYKELIAMDTTNAYSYGNFGGFLLNRDRPAEAIPYLEKAVALRPYGMAKSKLEEARAKLGKP